MAYVVLKWVHVLSATILFGTGIGSAFLLFMANRKRDVAAIHFATSHVVIADWLFTTPAILIQLATGLALLYVTGYALSDRWVLWGLVLYFFAGACWIPVVWMQIRMRDMASNAIEQKTSLPDAYWVFDKWWIVAGVLAFPAVAVIFYLMIAKP
jgi:uncharacterized membrane protein